MDSTAEQAGPSFWESLRRDFAKLREECAINPPLVPAGQLSAIWESQPEPGSWRLNYRSGNDGLGIAQRFRWHAASGAARLGFQGDVDAGVAYWLDNLKIDAPNSHLRRLKGGGSLEVIEILDICGLSADYCRKCEADETRMGRNSRDHASLQPVPPSETRTSSPLQNGDVGTDTQTADAPATAPASGDGNSPDQPIHLKAPSFVYKYARDFPAAEQLAIERARREANLQLERESVRSPDEYRGAFVKWLRHILSGAAPAIGRGGATRQWSLNRRLRMLLDLGLAAARAATPISRHQRHLGEIFQISEWQALTDSLVTASEMYIAQDDSGKIPPLPAKIGLQLLEGLDGKRKEFVTVALAAKFGGVTKRAIEKAVAKGSLESVGEKRNRRISVASLLRYFPPENITN